jgi:seryl-tRNA synthetase
MSAPAAATSDQQAFLVDLTEARLLLPSAVPGVFGRGESLRDLLDAVDALITRIAREEDGRAELLAFPPVMSRRELERIGYLESFPHLCGTIHAWQGESGEARQTDLVMVPAACYPSYPVVAARGPLEAPGVWLDLGASWVFRNEPSMDPSRMQAFHQREMVRFGSPETVAEWRDRWCTRALAMMQRLGLDASSDVASDPFFGRTGRMLARSQRAQALKLEVQVRHGDSSPTAVASFNCHRDHFASLYGLVSADGETAHTACLGFGLERIALALLRTHGCDRAAWPADVRRELFPSDA